MTAMYQSHFGFAEAPFSIAPDPRYLYMSQRHQEALAHLLYGLGGDGGFVLLTGEVGAGKTTLCRCLLGQIPGSCDVAYIFNPKLTVGELLSTLCVEFGIDHPAGNNSVKQYIDGINRHLLDAQARGRNTVLIIDEAQNLSVAVLEQMRLLTNLETSQRKLLQIILIGQPELAVMLDRPELRQLAQRIVARYHLGPLSRPELAAYVGHRLDVAGGRRHLFPGALMGYLLELINEILDLALIESGKATLSQEAVSLVEVMQECRAMVEPQAQKRGIGMSFPLFALPYFVSADRTRVKQVLINLLFNAVKYNKAQGMVVVEYVLKPPNSIRISVRDTGAGLSGEQLAQLFQPFNRLGKETGTEEGTGIGLVVTKRLVELMGGRIGVDSTVGLGSEFWFELGLTAAPPRMIDDADPADVAALPTMTDAPLRTILYVEDNPANLELVEHLITRRPELRLLSAADGKSGIEFARAYLPEVILMDINLPGVSGLDAMKTSAPIR